MKKKILFFILFLTSIIAYSQQYEDLYDRISKFKIRYEFDEVDCEIIEATDYIFDTTYDEEVLKEDFAYKSIVKWMDNTKIYHVIKGGKVLENCKRGSVLYNISRLGMTKYLFENDTLIQKSIGSSFRYININRVREIIHGGGEFFMEYLNKQDKDVIRKKINKPLRKGLKHYNEGTFEQFMSY